MACEALTRRIVREEPDGTITVPASSFLRHKPDCGTRMKGLVCDRCVRAFTPVFDGLWGGP